MPIDDEQEQSLDHTALILNRSRNRVAISTPEGVYEIDAVVYGTRDDSLLIRARPVRALQKPPAPPRTAEELREFTNRIVEEAATKRAVFIESFVVKFLQDTGLRLDEVEMVERQEGMSLVWFLRKRE